MHAALLCGYRHLTAVDRARRFPENHDLEVEVNLTCVSWRRLSLPAWVKTMTTTTFPTEGEDDRWLPSTSGRADVRVPFPTALRGSKRLAQVASDRSFSGNNISYSRE